MKHPDFENKRIIFGPLLDMPCVLIAGFDSLYTPRVSKSIQQKGFGISYLENGEVTWLLNGQEKLHQPGGFIAISQPGVTGHAEFNVISAEKFFWFEINTDPQAVKYTPFEPESFKSLLGELAKAGTIAIRANEELVKLYEMLHRNISVLSNHPENWIMIWKTRTLVSSILLEIAQSLSLSKEKEKDSKIIDTAKEFINTHIANNIGVREIAEHMNLSVAWITKQFLDHTGMAPAQYLRRQRIMKALQLLKETDESITEISYHTGFSSSQQLSRLIQKYVRMTPSQFRRKSRKGEI